MSDFGFGKFGQFPHYCRTLIIYSTVEDSEFSNNSRGIYLDDSSSNQISNCSIYSNNYNGIHLWDSSNNQISNCSISNNYNGIHLSSSSNDNTIHHNNFIDNLLDNAYDECSNQWDDSFEGNYWDDYTGVDENKDGIGDSLYEIPGGENQDRYPLMGAVEKKPKPDPRVKSIEFSVSAPQDGNEIEIMAIIENVGEIKAEKIVVSFFLGEELIGTGEVDELDAGKTALVKIT